MVWALCIACQGTSTYISKSKICLYLCIHPLFYSEMYHNWMYELQFPLQHRQWQTEHTRPHHLLHFLLVSLPPLSYIQINHTCIVVYFMQHIKLFSHGMENFLALLLLIQSDNMWFGTHLVIFNFVLLTLKV